VRIRIDPHTLVQARKRGVTVSEMEDVLRTGQAVPAGRGRLGRELVFQYKAFWQGRYHEHKKVRVIYVNEGGTLVTVTVYTFYGKWEN